MSLDSRFGGRTAIVTGAASGIGRATALRLAIDGAKVACVDLADAVDETVAAIADAGGDAVAVRADVTDVDAVAAAVTRAQDTFGPVKVLANVAGVLRFAHTHESDPADFDLQVAVNLKGPFLMCRAVIGSMLEHGGGAIVNVASSAGVFGQPYVAGYAASKGGVAMLSRALAWEYVRRGIRVNAVAPGGVQTPMTSAVAFPEGLDNKLMRKTIAVDYQMMPPEDPAALIAFLASDEASSITGTVIPIDHGITC
jgi:NAD(P)-dependent dehydrogenase (short-subunit alcohol dehydrogenase family)